jgi:hypothetical protein
MKVYLNEKLIKRNGRLGNIFSIGSLVILAGGMIFSFRNSQSGVSIAITYACLILGFLIFQVGNYFMNRWGKSPRPDELLTQSLKGLDDKFSLYHYITPISHLLVGPAGVIALVPYGQNGIIKFDVQKNSWRQHGGNFFLKLFGQEGLGKPNSEATYTKEELDRYLSKLGAEITSVKTNALLVFTNDKAEIQGEGSPVPYVTADKLKEYIRKRAKENLINTDAINSLIKPKE